MYLTAHRPHSLSHPYEFTAIPHRHSPPTAHARRGPFLRRRPSIHTDRGIFRPRLGNAIAEGQRFPPQFATRLLRTDGPIAVAQVQHLRRVCRRHARKPQRQPSSRNLLVQHLGNRRPHLRPGQHLADQHIPFPGAAALMRQANPLGDVLEIGEGKPRAPVAGNGRRAAIGDLQQGPRRQPADDPACAHSRSRGRDRPV